MHMHNMYIYIYIVLNVIYIMPLKYVSMRGSIPQDYHGDHPAEAFLCGLKMEGTNNGASLIGKMMIKCMFFNDVFNGKLIELNGS